MYQAIPYSSARPSWLVMPAADVVVVVKPEPPTSSVVTTVAACAAGEEDGVSRPAEPEPDAVVGDDDAAATAAEEEVRRAVAESPVLVVGRPGCCLGHVVKRLLQGLGVNPAVHEVADGAALGAGGLVPTADDLPAVFVGGKLLGGLDRLMAVHISGELVPILKKAGALWL